MTRAADVQEAARLGAAYVGVIFAGGPRTLTADHARDILRELPGAVRKVGVFGDTDPGVIATVTTSVGLDIVQLHADPDAATIHEVRRATGKLVWGVVRVADAELPENAAAIFGAADAIVLDARTPRALGGTGQPLPWGELSAGVEALRGRTTLVLAGGLTAVNVTAAVAALSPDIVDVSSGIESAPGVKDHQRMRAFLRAAHSNPRAA
jgi:phosphoribosylanthranilate isomerase